MKEKETLPRQSMFGDDVETAFLETLEDIIAFASKIQAGKQKQFMSPEEIVRQMRQNHDEQLLDALL